MPDNPDAVCRICMGTGRCWNCQAEDGEVERCRECGATGECETCDGTGDRP